MADPNPNQALLDQFKQTKADIDAMLEKKSLETKATAEETAKLRTELDEKKKELADIAESIKAQQAAHDEQQKQIDAIEAESKRFVAGANGAVIETAGSRFVASAGYKAFKESQLPKTGSINVGRLFERKAGELFPTAATRLVAPQRVEMVGLPQRRLRMRDIIPVVQVNSNKVEYIKEIGFYKVGATLAVTSITRSGQTATLTATAAHGFPIGSQQRVRVSGANQTEYNGDFWVTVTTATVFTFTVTGSPASGSGTILYQKIRTQGGADFQTEGSAKSQSALELELADADIRTLAHWMKISRQLAEDDAALMNFLENSLLVGLAYKEDRSLLYGSGSSPEINGILAEDGIQSITWSTSASGDTRIDVLRKAMTLVQYAEYEATAVVMNPFDWQSIELQKDGNDAYIFGPSLVAQGAGNQFFRLPVVVTNAINPGTALVGAFQNAATIYERGDASVQIFEQDEDNVQKNMLTLRAEERIGQAIPRPEAFVEVVLDTPPA